MEPVAQDPIEAVVARETWSVDDCKELTEHLLSVGNAPRRLRKILAEMAPAGTDVKGAEALKVGIVQYLLCRSAAALETLANATDNKDRRYLQAVCYKNLRQYDNAEEELIRAKDRGWDAGQIDLKLVELRALAGENKAADKQLSKLKGKAGDSAEYLYLRGLIDDLAGRYDEAAASYIAARQADPAHAAATFRLAYFYDLHGQEAEAIELYQELLARPPVCISALLNLAVLYEDIGKNDLSLACLRRVLAINPNHARARLFFKDAESSKSMYFDEDQAKRLAKQNTILDTPISDFELSVRARNCLKKMNIRCLGDLVRTSEVTLLGFKNFGETSLKEIKDLVIAKGLRLGQDTEESEDYYAETPAPDDGPAVGNSAVKLSQLEFSTRARRALEEMKILTLGDLASRTDAELLACKNFGQTTLNEVRQRLGEHGMRLRETT